MNFEERIFEHQGVKLKYHQAGQGRPILFFHGGGVKALTFQRALALLARDYRIVAPDIPPFGSSTGLKEIWGIEEYADFFLKFINELKLDNIYMIGHSLGGAIALNLAVKTPRISKLILVNSMGIPIKYSMLGFLYRFFIKEHIYELFFSEGKRSFLSVVKEIIVGGFRNSSNLPLIFKIAKKSLNQECSTLDRITIPTLILWGIEDKILSSKSAQELHQKIKTSKLEIIQGHHNWCLVDPELLVDKVKNFLSDEQ